MTLALRLNALVAAACITFACTTIAQRESSLTSVVKNCLQEADRSDTRASRKALFEALEACSQSDDYETVARLRPTVVERLIATYRRSDRQIQSLTISFIGMYRQDPEIARREYDEFMTYLRSIRESFKSKRTRTLCHMSMVSLALWIDRVQPLEGRELEAAKRLTATFAKSIENLEPSMRNAARRLAMRAKTRLSVVRVGSLAPDTRGNTLEGKTMRLADLRGRIVVLRFWGDW